MDCKSLCNLFNSSIFPKDYRTDLKTVQRHLEEAEKSLGTQTFDEQASFWLTKAIYHTFSGNVTAALTCLYTIAQTPSPSPRRLLRIATYYRYMEDCSHAHHRIGFRPEEVSGYGMVIRAAKQKEHLARLQGYRERFAAEATECDDVESMVLD